MTSNIDIAKSDWETYCTKIAQMIQKEQSPQMLLNIRGAVYELLSHCIPPVTVLKVSHGLLWSVKGGWWS